MVFKTSKGKGRSNSRFIVIDEVGLKLTKKEFDKAQERFMRREEMLSKKFRRMRA